MLVNAPGVLTTGTSGETVSTVKLRGLESGLTLPASSATVATALCTPSVRAMAGVKTQSPCELARAAPAATPSSHTVTVPLARAVPATSGLGVVTMAPGALNTGASGNTVVS